MMSMTIPQGSRKSSMVPRAGCGTRMLAWLEWDDAEAWDEQHCSEGFFLRG